MAPQAERRTAKMDLRRAFAPTSPARSEADIDAVTDNLNCRTPTKPLFQEPEQVDTGKTQVDELTKETLGEPRLERRLLPAFRHGAPLWWRKSEAAIA
jgi:hypothetical protein